MCVRSRCTTCPEQEQSEEWEVLTPAEMEWQVTSGWLALHYPQDGQLWGVTVAACEDVMGNGQAPVLCSPLSELRRYRLGERLDGSTVA